MSYLLFLLFGVYAILSCFRAIDGVTFTAWIVYMGPVLAGTLLWVSYYKIKNRWVFRGSVLGLLLFCGGYTAVLYDTLKEQFTALTDCLTGRMVDVEASLTTLFFLAGVFLTLLFFGFELLLKSHILLYILTTVLLILAPLLQVRLTVLDLAMIFLFQFFFWGLTWGEDREKEGKGSRRSVVMLVALSAVFVLALGLAYQFQDVLFDLAYDVEGSVTRWISEETGLSSMSMASGRISGGNRYQTGTEQLTVTADRKPEEDLYLRGFGGGIYTGGNWLRSSDEALFSGMMDELDWAEEQYDISIRYYLMYYVMNAATSGLEEDDRLQIWMRRSSNRFRSVFVPYDSMIHVDWDEWQSGESDYDMGFYLYEQKDMNIQWENASEDFAEERDKFAELQDAYLKAIQTPYTEVPEEKLPRLAELVEEHPLTDLNDITAFILYTLNRNCTYSLTPGWAPVNEDIVEYFLFDNGKGFCEHFASTATLMYRLYGVPARYATGYKASPDEFSENEDGLYEARLTDEDAHAWVEIFLPDYGWTPVEVTPSLNGVMSASYPGFDGSDYEEILSEYGWDQDPLTWLAEAGSSFSIGSSGDSYEDWEFMPDLSDDVTLTEEQLFDIMMFLLVCLVYALLFLPLILDYRRVFLIRRRQGENPRVTFDRLIRMLHFSGVLQTYAGSEPDFSDQLLAQVPNLSPQAWQQFYDCVSRIAYGPAENEHAALALVSEEELIQAREVYGTVAESLYKNLGWWKKQIFTYVKVFGSEVDFPEK